jgi:hypothetical protein
VAELSREAQMGDRGSTEGAVRAHSQLADDMGLLVAVGVLSLRVPFYFFNQAIDRQIALFETTCESYVIRSTGSRDWFSSC